MNRRFAMPIIGGKLKIRTMLSRVVVGSGTIALASGAFLGSAGPAQAAADTTITSGIAALYDPQAAVIKKVKSFQQPYLEGSMRGGIGTWVSLYNIHFESGAKTTIQWYRNNKAIQGGTGLSHKLVAADGGTTLHAVVTGKKPGYASTSVKAGPLAISFRLVLGGKPMISPAAGNPVVGTTYSASTAYSQTLVYDQPNRFTYQWKRNGEAIRGATNATYRASSADVGKKLSVTVKAYAHGFTTPATNTSDSTGIVVKGFRHSSTVLKLRGTAKVGGTMTVSTGLWLSGAKFSYQWEPVGGTDTPAPSASPSFKIPDTYSGTVIAVRVTAMKDGYLYTAQSGNSPLITR